MGSRRLTITIESESDPSTVDPHDIAESVVDVFNEWARLNGATPVEFVSAEWDA